MKARSGYKLRRKTHTLACGMKVAFSMKKNRLVSGKLQHSNLFKEEYICKLYEYIAENGLEKPTYEDLGLFEYDELPF